jgi:hypothetical protein
MAGRWPPFLSVLFLMEGESAGRDGAPADSNPYDPSTEQRDLWQRGWSAGRLETPPCRFCANLHHYSYHHNASRRRDDERL